MNINYLQNVILPQREKEIAEGKNLATANPIYVVLDLVEHVVSGHSEYSSITNSRGLAFEYGYVDSDLDFECREFSETKEEMTDPEKITRFYTDRFVAFFLTSKAAYEYIEYQHHNLTNPYIYVFTPGYRNEEMDNLFGY